MTDKVNGAVYAGEFLTGNMDFFSFATMVPVGQTNVTTEVVDLPGYATYQTLGTWTAVSITDAFGNIVTYSNLSDYLDAYYKQLNLNNLISTFSTRANPVAVSVKTFPASVNGGTINPHSSAIFAQMGYTNTAGTSVFGQGGSGYNSTGLAVYIVNIATEKTLLWTAGTTNGNFSVAADNTNTNGYNVLSNNATYGGLDGSIAYDLNGSQVIGGSQSFTGASTNYYTLKNTVAPYVTTWDASGTTTNGVNVMAAQNYFLAGSLLS